MRASSKPEDTEAGFTLVVVLWFLVLLAAFVGPFALAARTSAMITANQREKAKLELFADGLVTLLADSLAANPQLQEALPLNSDPVDCPTGQTLITFKLQDQSGLVDLNAADTPTIEAALLSVGAPQEMLQDLSTAVVAYRSYAASFGDLKPQSVAVDGDLKRAPFESVIELTDFASLAQVDAARLHANFTVHSGAGIVNRATSPTNLTKFLKSLPATAAQPPSLRRVAIETSVRNRRTAISGYAGYIIELTARQGGTMRIEPLPPAVAPPEPASTSRCPAWLTSAIAAASGGDA